MVSDYYIQVASKVLALCAAKDSYFPRASDGAILAWAEDLEHYEIREDFALEAVRKLYRENADPKFRPTSGLLCRTARTIRQEAQDRDDKQLEGKPKITRAEFLRRHPEVQFPAIGKSVNE